MPPTHIHASRRHAIALTKAVEVSGFMSAFWSATLENRQSEFLQLFTFAILTSFLIHRGSHESQDKDERVEMHLKEIERKLDALSGRASAKF